MMKDRELEQIVERAIKQEDNAFEQLCKYKAGDVLYVTYQILENMQDAEDIAQDILSYVYDHISELKDAGAFNVWLYRVIRGKCLNMIRKNKNLSKLLDESIREEKELSKRLDFLPAQYENSGKKQADLLKAVRQLSVRRKMCMLMFYYEGLSYEEISRSMEIQKKSVENILSGARKAILDSVEDVGAEEMAAYEIAAIPALAELLIHDMRKVITEDSISCVIAGTLDYVRHAKGSAERNAKKSAASEVVGKVVIGAVITAGTAAFGLAMYMNYRDLLAEQPPGMTESQMQADAVLPELEPDGEIHTLEDMIGDADASTLRSYAGVAELNQDEVEQFLFRIGMRIEEGVRRVAIEEEHTLYVYQKQDKMLMVILGTEEEADSCGLTYRFTNASENLPRDAEIPGSYIEWQFNGD